VGEMDINSEMKGSRVGTENFGINAIKNSFQY
jgi:hypothetical protein